MLGRNVDLNDSKAVETFILNLAGKNKYKNALLDVYQHFCKANNITWQKPKKLTEQAFNVKISTEERINVMISFTTKKYAVAFGLSKYGLTPDEVAKITLRDLDLERRELTVKSSKRGLERTYKQGRLTVLYIPESN